jgi:pimeloyl-ACP methyl ester carboxylesterase
MLGALGWAVEKPAEALTPITIDIPQKEMPLVNKRRRHLNHLFQFDNKPLGERTPVILLPGRAEEFQNSAWWKRFRVQADNHPTFGPNYKLYAFIYDSADELDTQAQDFVKDFKLYFGDLPPERKVVLVSYSLGGVITRDAMEDPEVMDRIHKVIAIGVPFHGTPIFDPDWFTKYMRNFSPIRQLWDRAIYRIYLLDKNNLTRGLKWDNFDHSLPLFKTDAEVHGDQVLAKFQPYVERSTTAEFKKKTILYASYLENNLTTKQPPSLDIPRITAGIPKAIVGAVLPLYGSSVHAVFIYMNHQLANLPTYSPDHLKGQNEHIYKYNDGVIPLSSALYLPASEKPYYGELEALTSKVDASLARVFVNIDHMHLGEYSIIKNKTLCLDVLHPEQGKRTPNYWVLHDLDQMVPELNAMKNASPTPATMTVR